MNREPVSDSLDSRYGRTSQRPPLPRWVWVALAAAGIVLAIFFGIWVQRDQFDAAPEFKDTGHQILNADQVAISFEVVKAPDSTAVCAVKALNDAGAPVGWKEITIPASSATAGGTQVMEVRESFRTTETANAVTVDNCWTRR